MDSDFNQDLKLNVQICYLLQEIFCKSYYHFYKQKLLKIDDFKDIVARNLTLEDIHKLLFQLNFIVPIKIISNRSKHIVYT